MPHRLLKSATLGFAVVPVTAAAVVLCMAFLKRSQDAISPNTPRITSIRIVPDLREIRLHKSRRVLNGLAMMPLDNADVVRAAMAHATFGKGDADVDESKKQQLLDAAATFLTLYGGRSPAPYREWRQQHGFTLTPPKNMEGAVDSGYEHWTGKPLPEGLTEDALFDAIWKGVRTKDDGRSNLAAVANDPDGVAVAFNSSADENAGWPQVESDIPKDVWYGNSIGAARLWWSRDRNVQSLRGDHKMVLDACVAAVVQFKSGGRHPLLMRFFWDELSKQWELEFASLSLIYADSNRFDLGYAIIEF